MWTEIKKYWPINNTLDKKKSTSVSIYLSIFWVFTCPKWHRRMWILVFFFFWLCNVDSCLMLEKRGVFLEIQRVPLRTWIVCAFSLKNQFLSLRTIPNKFYVQLLLSFLYLCSSLYSLLHKPPSKSKSNFTLISLYLSFYLLSQKSPSKSKSNKLQFQK